MKIAVENGSFGYGKTPILFDIGLAVRENKVLTILGPNGVGKTTLLKCMMGFLKWKTGMTLLDGRPMKEYSHREIWSKVSYVPQAKRNPFAYSILDTVVMGLNAEAGALSCPSHADYERAWNQLEWMGIADIASRNCNEVSGRQLQMALIARALVSEPSVLVLDEPESNLDMRNQLRVIEAIERIARQKSTTCIINTHFPDHALMVSDDTLFLGKGGTRLFGPTADVVNEENIRAYYQVDARVVDVSVEGRRMQTVFPFALA